MPAPVVIADEITAAGYRLAGADVRVPESVEVGEFLDAASAAAELVLITAELAAHVPPERLERALLGARPILLLIPDAGGRVPPRDLTSTLRRALGVET